MIIIKCKNCGREAEHHAKGMCTTCYKKLEWKPKKIICKRCKKERTHHGKGYCNPCYSFLFHYDKIKKYNYRKWHNLDIETYRKLTKACIICDFDKIVELHHLDGEHKNNSEKNLVALCPTHHRMIHIYSIRDEIFRTLKEKGFDVPEA